MLVVDDDRLVVETTARHLRRTGFTVDTAHDGKAAVELIHAKHFEIMLLDYARGTAVDVLRDLRASAIVDVPVVLILTGGVTVAQTVDLMKLGVRDVLEKPIDLAEIERRIRQLMSTATMKRRAATRLVRQAVQAPPMLESQAMRTVFGIADRVARSNARCVLITGESGVGKEVLATRIHQHSGRAAAPFVRINLAAIPDAMVEAELFGSTRGAFTGAQKDRAGMFASADGGTILLDEFVEFRYDMQAKLLRVLQEHRFFPVGSDQERKVDVRVIAATNRAPQEAIEARALREDLYYRISTVTIHIPPLRERVDDVLPLVEHFIRYFCAEEGQPPPALTPAARDALRGYGWPGNVRELRNVIERALMFCGDAIGLGDLGDLLSDPGGGELAKILWCGARGTRDQIRPRDALAGTVDVSPDVLKPAAPPNHETLAQARQRAVEDMERVFIQTALESVDFNQSQAARLLGISRSTLWEKVRRYGLKGVRPSEQPD